MQEFNFIRTASIYIKGRICHLKSFSSAMSCGTGMVRIVLFICNIVVWVGACCCLLLCFIGNSVTRKIGEGAQSLLFRALKRCRVQIFLSKNRIMFRYVICDLLAITITFHSLLIENLTLKMIRWGRIYSNIFIVYTQNILKTYFLLVCCLRPKPVS